MPPAAPQRPLHRRSFTLLLTALTATPALAEPPPATRRAVEMTFLKSAPGSREALKQSIVANWFAMDRIAQAQGLMDSYTVLDTGTDDGVWNLLVSVTYRDERGYEGIREAFERIRAAHPTVLIDGKTLRELGSVVESRKLYEDVPAAPR